MTIPATAALPAIVDVWIFPLDAQGRLAELRSLLAANEKARAARFVDPADGDCFAIGRAVLRMILASYLGSPPGEIALILGPQGKPALASPHGSLHFNLSHSGRYAAVAVCRSTEIGIDIEKIRPIEPGFAARFFSPAENAAISALPEPERLSALFRCWSRKEAVLKTLGVGLLGDFSSFDVSVGNEETPALARLDGPWSMKSLAPAEGYVGALATRRSAIVPNMRVLSEIWP